MIIGARRLEIGLNSAPGGNSSAVPLYRCAGCGFVTTASLENAAQAHEVGSPTCEGEIALVADFTHAPSVVPPGGRRRRSGAPSSGTGSAARPGPLRGDG